MDAFAGRLFGPDLPGTGVEATARWDSDGGLVLTHAGRELRAADPGIAAAGFNAAGLRLSWGTENGEHVFFVETEEARAACLASAPRQHAARLAAAAGRRGRVERRFRLGWAALLLLLLLPVLALGAFFLTQDDLADWVVRRIPYEQEARLGDLALAQARLQMPLAENGPAVEAIRAIGEPLTAGSPHRYRWFVADRLEAPDQPFRRRADLHPANQPGVISGTEIWSIYRDRGQLGGRSSGFGQVDPRQLRLTTGHGTDFAGHPQNAQAVRTIWRQPDFEADILEPECSKNRKT
jgi:hypothetical protein